MPVNSKALNSKAQNEMAKHDSIQRAAATPPVPILMYHQVSPRPAGNFRKYTVTPGMFALHLRWLRWRGYQAITLDALAAQRKAGSTFPAQGIAAGDLPGRPVVITFDDGFVDCARYAAPLLSRYGFTATIFLVAGLMGRMSEWLVRERGLALPLMDWDTARTLQAMGIGLGAHSMDHPQLAELAPDECRRQLVEARAMLEEQLGRPIVHMAYPHGAYNAQVRALAQAAGYVTACSVQIGHSPADDDLLALRRIPVNGNERFVDFVSRLHNAETLRGSMAKRGRDWRWGGEKRPMEVIK